MGNREVCGFFSQISDNCKSILVIASCQKQETSNYMGQISPFIEYVLDYFDLCLEENKKNAGKHVTSYCQLFDTPAKLYRYLEQRGKMPHPVTEVVLSDFGDLTQNVNLASKKGVDHFVLCPLH